MQIIAVDVSFCLRELLPGMFSKRIKADASLTGIRQHDTHLGCAIIVRAKNDIELAHRKTVHVILGVNFFKHFADTGISVLCGIHETTVA
jgi:hypothetical protein